MNFKALLDQLNKLDAENADKLLEANPLLADFIKEALTSRYTLSTDHVQLSLYAQLSGGSDDDSYWTMMSKVFDRMEESVKKMPFWSYTDEDGISYNPYEFCDKDFGPYHTRGGGVDGEGEEGYVMTFHADGSRGFPADVQAALSALFTKEVNEEAEKNGVTARILQPELFTKVHTTLRQTLTQEAPL